MKCTVSTLEYVERFNNLLLKEVSLRLRGAHDAYACYYGNWPSDIFPAGNLKPVRARSPTETEDEKPDRESDTSDVPQYMRSSYTPSSMGIAVYVRNRNKKSKVLIEGHFSVYRLVWPDRSYLAELFNERYGSNIGPGSTVSFPKRFTRSLISFSTELPLSVLEQGQFFRIPREDLEVEIEPHGDQRPLLRRPGESIGQIAFRDVEDDARYEEYIDRNNNGSAPDWRFEIQVRIKNHGQNDRLDLFLINRTESAEEPWMWSCDPFFFDPQVRAKLSNIDLARVAIPEITEMDYRYSTEVSATGRNCHVNVEPDENLVVTEILPVYEQPRIQWPNRIEGADFGYLTLGSEDPRARLELLAAAMKLYREQWEDSATLYNGERVTRENEAAWNQSTAAKSKFDNEIARFEEGIKSLDNEELRLAFQLMNQSFHERFHRTDESNSGWRPFQLVFVVSILPDILARERDDFSRYAATMPASVLWLPTGAGKTEAFTAAILVQAFYDRIRGKDAGASAILKFPLRFLSMQQLERAIMAIVAANRVLKREEEHIGALRQRRGLPKGEYDDFSVGFFVGESATPNDPNARRNRAMSPIDMITRGARGADDFLFIASCPHCRIEGRGENAVILDANRERGRIIHVCQTCRREIPLYLTDKEIYARLPTMIVSTIDKWAAVGHTFDTQMIFGIVRRKCPIHGYSFRNRGCITSPSCSRSTEMHGIYDGPPALVIQDELHMLDESLGALSSQFETFMKQMACSVNRIPNMSCKGPWKVIASTATIAGYERHVRSIYLNNAEVFPVKGPSSFDSFYYGHDRNRAQRLIVGFVPHNMTHPNAVIKTLQYFHAYVKTYENNPGKLAADFPAEFGGLSSQDEELLIANVRTSLMYGIVKSETYQILHSIEDQIDPYLVNEAGLGEGIMETADVTGDTGPRENVALLKKLQDPDFRERPEFIVATSSISHGVDLPLLNFMVFRGQPRSTAEFVQALSRVGRNYQGIIFTVYNPNRERDATHYMLHNEFLEIGNVLIAPPSVDRFSRHAIEKTAGSVIMGNTMLGLGDKSIVYSNNFLRLIQSPNTRTAVENAFVSSYLPNNALEMIPDRETYENDVRNAFARTLRRSVNEFERSGNPQYSTQLLRCLTSLRQTDIDVELIIEDGELRDEINRLRNPEEE